MIFLFLQSVSTVIIGYIIISPLNSVLYIHWILDFKSILLLIIVTIVIIRVIRVYNSNKSNNNIVIILVIFWRVLFIN